MNKKNRLFSFIFSLIPGAGHMYISLMKKGVSIMVLFFLLVAFSAFLYIDIAVYLLPVVWAYSFFDFWNLANMSVEDFEKIEDNPLFCGKFNSENFNMRYGVILGIVVIFIGIYMLFNMMSGALAVIFPSELVYWIEYNLPRLIVAVVLIIAGIWLIGHKKRQLKDGDDDE